MQEFNIHINGQYISIEEPPDGATLPDIVEDSVNYVKLNFSFDAEWEGYAKTVTFTNTLLSVTNVPNILSKAVPMADKLTFNIPWEVLVQEGELSLYVEGVKGEGEEFTKINTAFMDKRLKVTKSGKTDASEAGDPTPNLYEQILILLENFEPGGTGTGGVSPTAKVTKTEDGAEITITDINGTTTAKVYNGKDGSDGEKGEPGEPGKDYVLTDADKEEIASKVPGGTVSDEQIQNAVNNYLGEHPVSGGASAIMSATVPTNSTVGNPGDMLLVTVPPLRLYILGSIEDNKYNWTCIAGENVVFEDVEVEEEEPEDGDTRIPLELKLVKQTNNSNMMPTTPYFDYTAIDNVGDTTKYYTIKATCDEGYYISAGRRALSQVTSEYPETVGSPSTTESSFNNKAPYNDYKYCIVLIRPSNSTNVTNEQINDCVQNSNAKIQVLNDQDVVVAEYKLVNEVEG